MKPKIFLIILISVSLILCVQHERVVKPSITPSKTPTKAEPIDGECLACHKNPKRQYVPQAEGIDGHKNASRHCIRCHIRDAKNMSEREIFLALHSLHTSKHKDCKKCHKIYTREELECWRCHSSDPFKPSGCNVFEIHSPRNVGCKDCHGDDFIRIHYEHKIFPFQ
ncbi:MAG: hypothetical protein DRP01_05085 [Archaeoglobales archaeon]|nr:MAG: hypothetical protein DRP01_05085 [Archaeoglobales archaeon]